MRLSEAIALAGLMYRPVYATYAAILPDGDIGVCAMEGARRVAGAESYADWPMMHESVQPFDFIGVHHFLTHYPACECCEASSLFQKVIHWHDNHKMPWSAIALRVKKIEDKWLQEGQVQEEELHANGPVSCVPVDTTNMVAEETQMCG